MYSLTSLFAQQQPMPKIDEGMMAAIMAMLAAYFAVIAVVVIIVIVSFWMIFAKAGKPGWAALIPVYNYIVMLEIVGKPLWWIILFLIPCTAPIVAIIVAIELAKVFGKGGGFAAGLILLPVIFYPMLAFGSARYTPPPPQPQY